MKRVFLVGAMFSAFAACTTQQMEQTSADAALAASDIAAIAPVLTAFPLEASAPVASSAAQGK